MAKTFLQLCADVARESGAVGTAPATVLNQAGRQAKVVEWVRQANAQIMADNPDWQFLRTDFSGTLSINVMTYAPAAFNITGSFAKWLGDTQDYQPISLYVSGDQADEAVLSFIPYQSWRASFNRGTHDAMQPIYWSVDPNRNFLVGPKPDQAYVVRGEYQQGPQTLAQDGDVSLIPDQYQDAITWRACMMLALHDEAPTAFQAAVSKYGAILLNMTRDLLPATELSGNALA